MRRLFFMLQNEPIKMPTGIWACPVCSTVRKTRFHMEMHIRTHIGEKPFYCPYCNASFSQKGNCKTHIEKYHKA